MKILTDFEIDKHSILLTTSSSTTFQCHGVQLEEVPSLAVEELDASEAPEIFDNRRNSVSCFTFHHPHHHQNHY